MRARKLGTIVLIAVCAAGGLWLFVAVLFPLLLPLFIEGKGALKWKRWRSAM